MKMSDLPSSGPEGGREKEGRTLEFMRPGNGREDGREENREGGRGGQGKEEEDATWRLDKLSLSNSAPVLSPEGKVLRPFVILPSSSSNNPSNGGMSTRLRLQQQVFQPGHRLPTMSIDEFLDREMEMGNVLQGGGPSNTAEVEEAEREERAEREEDNRQGYEDEEGGLRKKREWDDWADTHRKGEGNMCVLGFPLSSFASLPVLQHGGAASSTDRGH
jgi:immunoglobulin-binding protein 1